jgi:hypothetical protein
MEAKAEPLDAAYVRFRMGEVLHKNGKLDEADAMLRSSLEVRAKTLGGEAGLSREVIWRDVPFEGCGAGPVRSGRPPEADDQGGPLGRRFERSRSVRGQGPSGGRYNLMSQIAPGGGHHAIRNDWGEFD